jgi:predicted phosphodiesterase
MKILAVSDNILAKLENRENLARNYSAVSAVISCGDLPAHYLEFIMDVLGVPLLYVRGNHDVHYTHEHPGGDNLHGRVLHFSGLLWAGLEGCLRYNREPIQYTQGEMLWQVLRLYPAAVSYTHLTLPTKA